MKYSSAKSALICVAFTMISSCSCDKSIAYDYKLYALDESNQAIIGHGGMINISDVTAYSIDKNNIYFETGIINNKVIFGKKCRYGLIDLKHSSVKIAVTNSSMYQVIRNNISKSPNGLVERSCVNKI